MHVLSHLKGMSPERFLQIYESLANQGFGPLDGEVAKLLKFRPQAIRKLPMDQRARRAKAFLERPQNSELCYELFGTYLLKHHKELVTGFLDETGVKHEDGMIDDLQAAQPDAAKLEETVSGLDAKFDAADVTLYLSMCSEQWPEVEQLATLYESRAGATA